MTDQSVKFKASTAVAAEAQRDAFEAICRTHGISWTAAGASVSASSDGIVLIHNYVFAEPQDLSPIARFFQGPKP